MMRTVLTVALVAAAVMPATAAEPLLTPERTKTLKQLYAQGHPWAKFVLDFADREPPPYGDLGQWSLLAWKMTGKRQYAQAAIQRSGSFDRNTNDRNFTRECSHYFALAYIWLKEEMTAKQRADYEDKLRHWAEGMIGRGEKGIFTRADDSDEVVGHYFGLALIDQALGTDYLQQKPGQDSIGGDEMRKRIGDFCRAAKGGEWIESSEYNLGTLQLLLIGASAVGMEEFPEVQALLPELSTYLRWSLTPDWKDSVQWGDIQEPHDLHLHGRVALMAQVIGLGGDPDGQLTQTLARLIEGRPVYPDYWMSLYRALWFFDPAALSKPAKSRGGQPEGLYVAEGMGLAICRDEGTLLQVHMPGMLYIDHMVAYFGDVRWWSGGEWVIDHPLGYGPSAPAHNVALLAGLGSMHQRGLVSAKETPGGCTIVGRTKGPRHVQPYYDPPPAFADWTREVKFDGKLTVSDRFVGGPIQRADRYYPQEQAAIKDAAALWTQLWHAPVEPQETAEGFTWQTKGGQQVTLRTNAKRREKRRDENGKTLEGNFHPQELTGWQIRLFSDDPKTEIVTSIEVSRGRSRR